VATICTSKLTDDLKYKN